MRLRALGTGTRGPPGRGNRPHIAVEARDQTAAGGSRLSSDAIVIRVPGARRTCCRRDCGQIDRSLTGVAWHVGPLSQRARAAGHQVGSRQLAVARQREDRGVLELGRMPAVRHVDSCVGVAWSGRPGSNRLVPGADSSEVMAAYSSQVTSHRHLRPPQIQMVCLLQTARGSDSNRSHGMGVHRHS